MTKHNCAQCGVSFVRKGRERCCSTKCRNKSAKKNMQDIWKNARQRTKKGEFAQGKILPSDDSWLNPQ